MLLAFGFLIFILVFYCIITEKLPDSWATMIGGLTMSIMGIMHQEEALDAVSESLEILLLLIGMMIIVMFISETGIFQWFAIKVAQFVRGDPFKLIVLLSIITAVFSAFLDNVTTILLMIPMTMVLAKQLKLDPFPFIISEIMSANIGGLATLIGDPPQLIIGSEANLSFNSFLVNAAPLSVLSLLSLIITIYFLYGKDMKISNQLRAKILELDASRTLKDRNLLKQSLIIFILVILGFMLNNFIDRGLAIIALTGAITLAIITKREPKEILEGVEWDTLFFFIGLFIMVKGIENLGITKFLGDNLIFLTAGKFKVATMSIIWLSSFFTAIIGNVANAATFSKIIHTMSPSFQHLGNTEVFWWALSFGSCLGGNITILASASNVVAVGVATKAGFKIDFMKFLRFGSLIALENLIIASLYIYFRYL